jgi:hypothetical protein
MENNIFSEEKIARIEAALRLREEYNGKSIPGYLKIMDSLSTMERADNLGQKLSMTLDKYFKQVGVNNFDEAIERLKKIDKNNGKNRI